LSLRNLGSKGAWHYFRCATCGGVQLFPIPSEAELGRFYNSEYEVDMTGHVRQMETIGNRMLDLLEGKTQGRRILEIGCSYGAFLRLARQRGWSCVGVEASNRAAARAQKEGLEVYAGTLERNRAELNGRKFDVIALWHVIEHVADARSLLDSLFCMLTDDGYLALRTPNAESAGAILLGLAWEWFHAPEHVFIYTAHGIQQLFRECNLQVETLLTQRGDAQTLLSQAVTAFGTVSIRKVRRNGSAGQRTPSRLLTVHRKVSSVLNFAGRPIDELLGLNGDNLRGSELVILARKNNPVSPVRVPGSSSCFQHSSTPVHRTMNLSRLR
jgi:2-polyprenyl-3-methyl-5-hydroxy-6-metoxy-1,4-benzoquinol methylase